LGNAVSLADVLQRDPPCDQCALCCLTERCTVSLKFFPAVEKKALCPALEQVEGKYRCGLVANPLQYSEEIGIEWPTSDHQELGNHFRLLIGIGSGCDYEREFRHPTEC